MFSMNMKRNVLNFYDFKGSEDMDIYVDIFR